VRGAAVDFDLGGAERTGAIVQDVQGHGVKIAVAAGPASVTLTQGSR
jgi:hypothetical protein